MRNGAKLVVTALVTSVFVLVTLQFHPLTKTTHVELIQRFDIPDRLNHSSSNLQLESMQVNLDDLSKFMEPVSPEFYQEMERLGNLSRDGSTAATDLQDLGYFKPLFNRLSRARFMFTMDVFVRACEKYGWDYFLIGGSLLGAHRHHGAIPWDDDMDIIVNSSHWREVRHVLGNMPGFTLWANENEVWRFFLSDLPPIPGLVHKWPFLDLFFFQDFPNHIMGLFDHVSYIRYDKKYVLPLRKVRWERWELPVPACTTRLLVDEYKDITETCKSSPAVHEFARGRESHSVPCSKLYNAFPFVFRQTDPAGKFVKETLKIGDRVLQEVVSAKEPDVCQT